MAAINSKQLKRLLSELKKQLGREPSVDELRRAMRGDK